MNNNLLLNTFIGKKDILEKELNSIITQLTDLFGEPAARLIVVSSLRRVSNTNSCIDHVQAARAQDADSAIYGITEKTRK